MILWQSFNPRTRTGCDCTDFGFKAINDVSTHAPARGATPPFTHIILPCVWFQPTHPHGVRPSPLNPRTRLHKLFQPTHPHGVRLPRYRGTVNLFLFQPTHPHGVRQWKEKLRFYVRLSTRSREPLWKERQQNLAIKQKRVKALLKLFCEFLWKTKIT